MIVESVTEHICLIGGRNTASFPHSHSFLILDEEVVLIDSGCGIENLKELRQNYDVDYVVNSHTHPDHAAGNWVFSDKPIHVPEQGIDTAGNMLALSERFTNRQLAATLRGFMSGTLDFRDCRPTHTYNADDVLEFGKTKLLPVHTPGHSSDHYCFFEETLGILFSFDYDLTSFPWYGHLEPESNLPEFRESVRKLKALRPKTVVSSHRGIVSRDIGAEFDSFLRILDTREDQILALLEGGRTLRQLVDCAPIYGSFPYIEAVLRFWEGQMIQKHLDEMEMAGRVTRRGGLYMRA